jgi:hypothetical protein
MFLAFVAQDRAVTIGVLFAGSKLLILVPQSASSRSDNTEQLMIFAKEDDLAAALTALRV